MNDQQRAAMQDAIDCCEDNAPYEAARILREALAQPQGEPVAWMFQHQDTGRITCVEAQQVEWGFEKNNPRWQRIAPLYTTPPSVEAAIEATKEKAAKVCEERLMTHPIKDDVNDAYQLAINGSAAAIRGMK